MHPPPSCTALGSQCHQLSTILRIGSLEEGEESLDHESTWLLGHTDRISFRGPRVEGNDLLVDALLHVRCRFLKTGEAPGSSRCSAHGFTGSAMGLSRGAAQPRKLGGDRFLVVQAQQMSALDLPFPPRSLPVIEGDDFNPCSIAPCSTADNTRGSACCRDLQVEIMCTKAEHELEALVRSRQSPYLCKVTREGARSLDAEMISACGYLDEAGANCTLHGRFRADGRTGKPDLCSAWPDDGKGMHPGCLWTPEPKPKKHRQLYVGIATSDTVQPADRQAS